jgi:Arm DNA-binding domain
LLVYLLVFESLGGDTNMLKDVAVRNAKPSAKPRKLSDGGGLHILIQPTGSKLWRLAYRFAGKQKTLALGVYSAISLEEARRRREEAKKILVCSIDPIGPTQVRQACWKEQ